MDRITLKNFKVFKEETTFDLAPVTILTGKNNSGKSSLIKAFILLSDFLSSDNQTILSFSGDLAHKHKINRFENACNWDSDTKQLELTYERSQFRLMLKFSGEDRDVFAFLSQAVVTHLLTKREISLQRLQKSTYRVNVPQLLTQDPKEWQDPRLGEIEDTIREIGKIDLTLNDLKKRQGSKGTPSEELSELLSQAQQLQNRRKLLEGKLKGLKSDSQNQGKDVYYNSDIDLSKGIFDFTISRVVQEAVYQYEEIRGEQRNETRVKIDTLRIGDLLDSLTSHNYEHLGPNRTHQSRLYFNQNSFSEINTIIGRYGQNPAKKGTPAYRFLKKWLKTFEIGRNVRVTPIEGVATQVEVQHTDGRWVNLSDKGFGAGQVLTILLSIANILNQMEGDTYLANSYSVPPLVLIEEPETNLHPYLQSKLAELFYEANREFKIQFIIETHSEYLVRKTQAIVKETQNPDAFKVYYFDKEQGIYPMRYREDGKFMDEFGEGFFDEASKLAFKLF